MLRGTEVARVLAALVLLRRRSSARAPAARVGATTRAPVDGRTRTTVSRLEGAVLQPLGAPGGISRVRHPAGVRRPAEEIALHAVTHDDSLALLHGGRDAHRLCTCREATGGGGHELRGQPIRELVRPALRDAGQRGAAALTLVIVEAAAGCGDLLTGVGLVECRLTAGLHPLHLLAVKRLHRCQTGVLCSGGGGGGDTTRPLGGRHCRLLLVVPDVRELAPADHLHVGLCQQDIVGRVEGVAAGAVADNDVVLLGEVRLGIQNEPAAVAALPEAVLGHCVGRRTADAGKCIVVEDPVRPLEESSHLGRILRES